MTEDGCSVTERQDLTIKGCRYPLSVETARRVAAMIDVHDKPGQSARFRTTLRAEIAAELGGMNPNRALNTARTVARVLELLGLRERPGHVRPSLSDSSWVHQSSAGLPGLGKRR